MLATLMLAGYVPLPVGVAGGAARPAAGSCCAPKACCMAAHGAAHGCSAGGACEQGPGAGKVARGPMLMAGGCGMPTPRITPVSQDPTLAPRADLAGAHWAGLASRVQVQELIFSGVAPDPSVPPPRA